MSAWKKWFLILLWFLLLAPSFLFYGLLVDKYLLRR